MINLLLNIFTFANLMILFLLVFSKRDNSISSKFLSAILLNQAIYFFNSIFILAGWIYQFPHMLFITYAVAQLNAPLIYINVEKLLGRKVKSVHPFYFLTGFTILLDLFFWIGFLGMGSPEKLSFLNGLNSMSYPWQMNVLNGLIVLSQFCYLLLSVVHIRQYSKKAGDQYFNLENIQVRYTQNNNILIFLLNFVIIFFYIVLPTPTVVYFIIPLEVNLMYLYFIYSIIRNSVVFSSVKSDLLNNTVSGSGRLYNRRLEDKQLAIQLEPDLIESYSTRIIQFIEDQKPFIDAGLTLEKFSRQLNIPKHHLSFVINNKLKKNFFDLINSFRVEEAKKLLSIIDKKSVSVDSIGYDVGFNTKSAFYRSFKKYTNQTPAQFSKKNNPA
jgi:AraC-like DNA-binding protein